MESWISAINALLNVLNVQVVETISALSAWKARYCLKEAVCNVLMMMETSTSKKKSAKRNVGKINV